jgi:RNA polymerase sigma-70 factor (ECF subfamily)
MRIPFRRNNLSKLSDEELLIKHREGGGNEYLGELFNRYTPLIYGVCLKYLKDPNIAQDAVMQLFEDLLEKMAGYEIDVFRSWIYTVAKNHCLQLLRKENREISVDFNAYFNADFMEYDQIMYLLEEEDNYERTKVLKNCLERLPEQQRVSILYFFMDNLSYADIVYKTRYSLNHVKSYIQNGKRNLKICIEKNS